MPHDLYLILLMLGGAINHIVAVRLVFNKLKKLSMAELSQTSPARLMLQVMPSSLRNSWRCSLVYWLPWSKGCSSATGLTRPPLPGASTPR